MSNLSTRQNFSRIFGIHSIHAERIMRYKPVLACKYFVYYVNKNR